MPLTDDGFIMPEKDDVLARQEQLLKDDFGDDIDTSPGSIFGRLARYNAQNKVATNEAEQQNYDGANVMTATGVQLDRQAANAGIQRNMAQYAEAQLDITGTPGYVIPEGTNFETDNGDVFTTTEDAQIPDAPKGSTDGSLQGVITISQDAAAYENVSANTIVNQSEPVDDITSVNNPKPASGGSDLETDFDLRTRIRQNLIAKPGPQPEGLRTALLNINGVSGVHMQCNTNNHPDQFGNPPHSIHFFISGGSDPEVESEIYHALAHNAAYGTTFVCDKDIHKSSTVNTSHETDYTDDSMAGSTFHISYDDAQPQNLYFKLTLKVSAGYDPDAVKQSIDDFLSDFDMGNTIIINKLYSYLYNLDGIDEVTDIEVSKDGKNYSNHDVQLQNFQIARVNNDDTDIQLNPPSYNPASNGATNNA